ncbi:MAG: hypothetical protein NWF14_00900, partial [Candidatus Bathyarchaeota archaeon]|nr:hypothetical protein [Candidatus Bathyarchaeota archaeon]
MIVLSVSSCCVWAYAENGSETTEVPLWLVLRFRDYNTGIAVSNISISAEVRTDWGTMTISSKLNETGIIEVFLGNVAKGTHFGLRRLQELELSGNYTLIKVQNVFMEDSSYSLRYYRTEYVANFTRHEGMRIELPYKALEDRHMIEGNIWVLEGDLVRVLDSNPVTGQKENLVVAPAISLVEYAPSEISELERYYFFPLDYEVTIFHKFRTSIDSGTLAMRYTSDTVSPLRVTVDENTTLINWMFHAAEEYVERQTYRMDKELEWLNSSGYPLDREHEEYQAIQSLLERALGLYREGEYMPALGGAKISDTKLSGLTKWISDLKILAILTTIGISLFAYGLASLLSSFIFEEQSANKIRLASKVLTFSLVMLMFSLSHPSLRITYALIIGSRNITLPVSLLGCFIVGGLNYFFVQLLSVRRKTMTDLALQLGVRSLKRRRSRTLLTLLTITIIVSSAIVFVDISMNRATRIKGQWQGTNTLGVLIKPNTFLAPISVHDVNWTHAQEWCKDLAYTEEVRRLQMRSEGDMMRIGILILEEKTFSANIVGIDPLFMERYYGFSGHITGFWQEFLEGEPVAIVPIELGILTNEPVTLAVEETEGETTVTRTLGEFQVVGTFDPSTAFDNLTKIDNGPLFEDPSRLVLIPINSIKDSAITISEVTILLEEGYEPVDVA